VADLRKLSLRHITNDSGKSKSFVAVNLAKVNNVFSEVDIHAWSGNMASHSKLVVEQGYSTRLLKVLKVSDA
jgi:hypothetical protein